MDEEVLAARDELRRHPRRGEREAVEGAEQRRGRRRAAVHLDVVVRGRVAAARGVGELSCARKWSRAQVRSRAHLDAVVRVAARVGEVLDREGAEGEDDGLLLLDKKGKADKGDSECKPRDLWPERKIR